MAAEQPRQLDDIEKALNAITPILFDGQKPDKVDWESQNANDVVNLQLKKAWINWVLGDVDNIIENINMGNATYIGNDSFNARMIKTGENSSDLAYKLAYEIDPKLRMIKDVKRSLEKLDYLANNKENPDYKRCVFNLNTTLQYLMSDVQPQLEQFLNLTDINTNLAGIEDNIVQDFEKTHMFGGGKRKKYRKRRTSRSQSRKRKSKSPPRRRKQKRGARRKAPRKKRASPKRRSSPKRRRSAKPLTRWAW